MITHHIGLSKTENDDDCDWSDCRGVVGLAVSCTGCRGNREEQMEANADSLFPLMFLSPF